MPRQNPGGSPERSKRGPVIQVPVSERRKRPKPEHFGCRRCGGQRRETVDGIRWTPDTPDQGWIGRASSLFRKKRLSKEMGVVGLVRIKFPTERNLEFRN